MDEEFQDDLPRPHGDSDLIEAVVEHWEKFLGPCTEVFHEIVSEFVHLDVYQFGPDPVSGLTTFVTSGMAEKPMNTPAKLPNPEKFRYVELVLQVSNSWIQTLGEVPVYKTWPIRELKQAARLPHRNETWLWCGHTLLSDPPTFLAPDTQFCATTIWPSFILPEGSWSLQMDDGRKITFLSLGFLYREELEYSRKHTQDKFIDFLEESEIDVHDLIIFNPGRPNTCENIGHGAVQVKNPWWKFGK